ncbi:MAG: transposase [Ktedonobacterales bacterium]|nr:transposase [Ktedonobacterales bacterium]
MPLVHRAFKYKLNPTPEQDRVLWWTLTRCRELYNAALQERRDAWRMRRVSLNSYDQKAELPGVKEARPEYKDIQSQVLQDHKAASAGRQVVAVPPHHTSQDCSRCGTRVPKSLSVRTHICPNCGLVMDRDENSANEIKRRGQRLRGYSGIPE